MSEQAIYTLDHVFDAPRERVWRAWTDPDILKTWYGPNVETIIHKFDFVQGGLWLNEMKWAGNSMFSKVIFEDIKPLEKMIWHQHSTTDKDWNTIANPQMPDWPRILLTTLTFEKEGDKTKVRLTWEPYEATDGERTCFVGAMHMMGKGWESGYAILNEILIKQQA